MNESTKGIVITITAYVTWGFLPMFWKLFESINANDVLAHRIFWSFIFMSLFIFVFKGQTKQFIAECIRLLNNKKALFLMIGAAMTISLNWLLFIWAVQNDHIIQTSLGYYINPLISVLLAIVFLSERLSQVQIVSFILAGIGVIYLTINYGVFPWIAIILACSFSLYGLFKKILNMDAFISLTIELFLVLPIALLYLLFNYGATLGFLEHSSAINTYLILSGIATTIPLLLFGYGVTRIPLSLSGFIQYIAPTMILFIGIFYYNETFTKTHLISFFFIWTSLILFMTASLNTRRKKLKS